MHKPTDALKLRWWVGARQISVKPFEFSADVLPLFETSSNSTTCPSLRPLYEALVLMADKNFGGVTVHAVVFRQFYCSTERLRFTWESCGNAAMGILDFPCAIVVHHNISRFMQLFSPTYVFPHSSEDNALARVQFSHF